MASASVAPKPTYSNEAQMVTDIIERRNESRKWMRKNINPELTEVWRAIKVRTAPIYKKDRAGVDTQTEDKSRTNVAMPDLNIIYRRNAARMTANPYRLEYTGGDPLVADMLSALSMQQYARSNEAFHDVRVVLASEAFGWGYSKLFWDKLVRTMKFRRAIMKNKAVIFRKRGDIMRFQGASEDEIEGAVAEFGEDMDDNEIAKFMAKSGTEVTVPQELKQFEGPIVKWIFNGDLFIEPNAATLERSSYAIEQFTENDLWLEKMSRMTYEDPDTGRITSAFDPDALQELLDTGGDVDQRENEPGDDLRDMFNAAIGREREQEYYLPKNLRPRKKFNLLEQHSQDDEDGRFYITWVSERYRDKTLGRMPYQYDLYGKYQYTDMTPLPDLIVSFGDSTPRLLRHLYQMHNLTVAQNFDYVTNLLKPFLLRRIGVNIEPEVVVRGLFRELQVADLNGVKPLTEPPLPTGAFEREAQIMRMLSLAEPALTSTEGGTAANPQAGKTATTALLASKAADALTQFKFDGRNRYLRELGLKKLWMNQQGREKEQRWEIEQAYWNTSLRKRVDALQGQMPDWALRQGSDKVYAVSLDPMEIQQDFQVEPEAGSYLAVDDEMRQQAAQNLTQVAMANPDIVDRRKVIRFQMSTIKGIGDPDAYFLPEQQGPQEPPVKINANVQIPLDKMPADIVNQLLPAIGLQPSQTLESNDQIDQFQKTAEAAQTGGEAADSLMSPGESEQAEHERGAEHAMQIVQNAHEAQQQSDQQLHEAVMTGVEHGHAMRQQHQEHQHAMDEAAQTHAHNLREAEQTHAQNLHAAEQQHRHALTQGAQQQRSQSQQKGAEIASKERLHAAGLESQEKIAGQKNKPNGKPAKANPNGRIGASSGPEPTVIHLKIDHGGGERGGGGKRTISLIRDKDGTATGAEVHDHRRRKVKLIRGEDGLATGAEISEE
jgi:hypothetical protein